MQLPTIPKVGRLSKKHKITAAGIAAAAAVALTVTGLEATAGGSAAAAGDPTGFSVSTGDQVKQVPAQSGMASQKAVTDQAAKDRADKAAKAAEEAKAAADKAAKAARTAHDSKSAKDAADAKKAAGEAAAKKAVSDALAKQKSADEAAAKKASDQAAAKKADAAKKAREAAPNRSAKRTEVKTEPVAEPSAAPKAAPVYPNTLDGWIRHAQAELAANKIPVPTYNGIYRNIIRESSGNPNAINLWDINARNGVPSKGLLQVIAPTFQTYHVPGTSWNIYDPVANISAACNYAWHRYGGMDNVNSAY